MLGGVGFGGRGWWGRGAGVGSFADPVCAKRPPGPSWAGAVAAWELAGKLGGSVAVAVGSAVAAGAAGLVPGAGSGGGTGCPDVIEDGGERAARVTVEGTRNLTGRSRGDRSGVKAGAQKGWPAHSRVTAAAA